MNAKEKLPVTAWLSTVFIGVYTLFLVIGMAVLLFYTKHITTAGTHMVSEARMMSDYISGYMVLPGAFTALLGSFTGVMALLLAVGIFIPVLVCPVTLVISCILLKKNEATNRCLDETNCFPYSFRPFLDYFPEHLDKHHYGNTCCP